MTLNTRVSHSLFLSLPHTHTKTSTHTKLLPVSDRDDDSSVPCTVFFSFFFSLEAKWGQKNSIFFYFLNATAGNKILVVLQFFKAVCRIASELGFFIRDGKDKGKSQREPYREAVQG